MLCDLVPVKLKEPGAPLEWEAHSATSRRRFMISDGRDWRIGARTGFHAGHLTLVSVTNDVGGWHWPA
jgi:hypothetical protein